MRNDLAHVKNQFGGHNTNMKKGRIKFILANSAKNST